MGLFDRLRGNSGPRVVFLGIDGVPFDLITSHPSRFPNLTRIIEQGSAGPMDSIVPPESSACWPSLTTGVNPGKTGVYGFQDREIGSYDTYIPMGRDVQATRLWDRVQEANRNATVLNVPVSFPPQRNIQRMVSGFLSPGVEKASYPTDVSEFLQSIEYKIDVNAKLGHNNDKTEFIQDANDTLAKRQSAFSHYLSADDWDLFFGVFMTTDRVNHFLFRDYAEEGEYYEEFLDFYSTLDEYIGELAASLADDTTLVIASDHGFTTLEYEVNCNQWLREHNWLSFETDDPEELGDISNDTRAYSLIPGRFYINLEGREPRGSVPRGQYEPTRDELKEALLSFEGPDGTPVCERVVEKDEAFFGDHDEIAPDLVAIPTGGFDLKAGFKDKNTVFDTGPRNGMHSFSDATLIVDDAGVTVGECDLFDIAPTILDLMDISYEDREFDGRSLV